MRKFVITVLLFTGVISCTFSQKLDFSAYLASGGGVHSSAPSVADKNGNIFIAGCTREGLKVTDDAFQKSYKGHTDKDVTGGDAFLMKLSPTGELIYSTYIGGSGSENYCLKLALDDSDNVYVGFTTESCDLPVSDNACQKTLKGENDHYIIKFSNDCRYIASTYLGGSGSDHWTTLGVNNNALYLFGKTKSPDFPTTKKAVQKGYDNSAPPDSSQSWMSGDITISALSLNLDKVLYSTYLGGKSLDYIRSFSFGSDGKIMLVGATYSDNYPVTKNAFRKSLGGKKDGFLTIVSKNLSKIDYSTLIGGDSTDQVNSVYAEDADHIIIAGETQSPDFPVTSDALNKKYLGGKSDGFIMNFNLTSNKPVYSTFFGGSKTDWLKFITKGDDQKFVVVGTSSSKDFPVTKDALYPSINGGMDLVVSVLDETLKDIKYSTYGGGSKQIVMDPVVNYVKGGGLIISSICISPDFPVKIKYAKPDSTWTNCLWKFDLTRKYDNLIRQADSLYQVKNYKQSALAFSDAFKAHDAKISINHRYNAACSWSLANYPDSAFSNLNYISTFMNYTNYGLLKSDPDLVPLHNDTRWNPLLESVLANKKKSFPNLSLIPVNGFKVETVTYGLEHNQKGKPVIVFENGRGTDFEYWLPIIKEVSKENATFAYNRPRIGGSEDDNQIPTIDHIAEILRQLLLAQGLNPPYILVGHSWGGACIRYFASLHPEEIAGLIFVDPHDFVKNEGGGRLPYQQIGLKESQIDSLFAEYDKWADEYMAQGPKFVVEEMKAQREFSKTGFNLCNRNPLPDVPVHFIMAGGYPVIPEQTASLYDQEKMFRINNAIKMKSWLEQINPLKYGKFIYCSSSGHIIQKDDPDVIISSIKLALLDYDKILKGKETSH